MVVVRKAKIEDLKSITAIYNYAIRNLTATFDEEEKTWEDRMDWFASHQNEDFPLLVVEDKGEVLGWGSVSPFRPRSAYRFTGETSIYIHNGVHGQGLGTKIMEELINLAEQSDLQTLVAVIADDNEASIKLHAKFGFETAGYLKQVGYKFNNWVDVVIMQRMI